MSVDRCKSGQDNRSIGRYGEQIAAEYLAEQGYSILERNFCSRVGEVDIIARDRQGTVVFVEVKTRRSLSYGVPQLAVTGQKQHQIIKAALSWLSRNKLHDSSARFDVIAILLPGSGRPQVEHIINAFDLSSF